MDQYRELADRLKTLNLPRRVFYQGIVKSVEGLTCTVEIEGLDIPDVRLRASVADNDKDLLITPAIGSPVLVASLSGDFLDLAIVSLDQAEKIHFHGGAQGGLVLVEQLTERLNLLEQSLNDLKQVLSSWTPVPNDGGASLKTSVASWAGKKLQETQLSQLENKQIKQ